MTSQQAETLKQEKISIIASETIDQLAKRHLRDRNHTTTDEEIKNARIVIDNKTLEDNLPPYLRSNSNQ